MPKWPLAMMHGLRQNTICSSTIYQQAQMECEFKYEKKEENTHRFHSTVYDVRRQQKK